jgi:putative NIF3 family GTP cyclohydrolase 1 type 2
MPQIIEAVAFLDDWMTPEAFDDLGPNGLQVPAERELERVVTGVTAQRALFDRAVAEEAQLVLVHHGLFWSFNPLGLTPLLAERLRPLFKHDIALAAYHLPLDAHPEIGNNALLASALGAQEHVAFAGIGRGATFGEPVPAAELVARVAAATGREPLVFDAGPPDRDRLRRRREPAGPGGRRGLRRVPHRRAEGERDGRRARGGHPLHRRRPLRDRDVRRAPAGRTARRAVRDRARLGRPPESGVSRVCGMFSSD